MSENAYAPRPLRTAVGDHVGGGTPPRQVPSYWKGDIPWASVKDFPEQAEVITDTQEHISVAGLSASASNLIPAGTPLVCTRMAVGRAAMPSVEMAINQDVKALFPAAGVSAAYLLKVLQFIQPKAEAQAVGSTVKGIRIQDYLNISVPLADTNAQPLIVAVLSTLDTAIQETEAIIAKLKAVKQGLLHDLLTRGIDANGELRPPQTEAPHLYKESPLGWIPKEWDIATLEAVSATVTSGSRDWARFYADSGAVFVRIGNLTREHINFRFDSTIYVRPPRNADGHRTRLEPGDILISITADLGIVGVVPDGMGEAYINQHIALVRPSHGVVNPRFVGHYLASPAAQTYISMLNDAGAKAGLNLPTVRGLLTARPARTEQDLIAERLDEIDHRIQNATTELAKLRELKAGLMDDLLTGRVRVTPLL
ncbi:MAG: restriction endonuclease subunit S, partial [Halothiobacillaceae bacterium]